MSKIEIANIETEKALLGSLFVEQQKTVQILLNMGVNELWFFDSLCRSVYNGCIKAINSGNKISMPTIKEFMEPSQLAFGDPMSEIIRWVDSCVPQHAMHYCQILKDKYQRRTAIETLRDAEEKLLGAETVSDVIAEVRHELQKVPGGKTESKSIEYELKQAEEKSKIAKIKGFTGTQARWLAYQKMFGGMPCGQHILLTGRPSQGKSTLVNNQMMFTATKGIPVAVVSLEMSVQDWMVNAVCAEAGLNAQHFRDGLLDTIDLECYNEWSRKASTLPIYMNDKKQTIQSMCTWIRDQIDDKGVKLVIIDYIGLLVYNGPHTTDNSKVSSYSSAIKNLTKEYPDVTFVTLCQLNRGSALKMKDGVVNRPYMSDLRDSGSLEQDADQVIMVYQDPQYGDNVIEDMVTTVVDMAKNRLGSIGQIRLTFHKTMQRFEEYHG